jgi:hypothetical protein
MPVDLLGGHTLALWDSGLLPCYAGNDALKG